MCIKTKFRLSVECLAVVLCRAPCRLLAGRTNPASTCKWVCSSVSFPTPPLSFSTPTPSFSMHPFSFSTPPPSFPTPYSIFSTIPPSFSTTVSLNQYSQHYNPHTHTLALLVGAGCEADWAPLDFIALAPCGKTRITAQIRKAKLRSHTSREGEVSCLFLRTWPSSAGDMPDHVE